MSLNQIQMLIIGAAFGAQVMNLLHVRWDRQNASRSTAASRAALKQARGDLFMSTFCAYRWKNRSRV
ncbi:hypothetical protein [Streptomyces sp. NPDC005732]|uniref:hypothetical protein n=1 Tax=Streptomyces sp. NPDC005732 TaxID=3157057 RepID=UPI0033CF2A6F